MLDRERSHMAKLKIAGVCLCRSRDASRERHYSDAHAFKLNQAEIARKNIVNNIIYFFRS